MTRSYVGKTLAWGAWGANIAAIVGFWWAGSAAIEVTSGDLATVAHAFARLFGLLATFCALMQFVLMGRLGWLEPIFGLDRLAIFHRRNGVAALVFILSHAATMIVTHGALSGQDALSTLGLPFVWAAATAEVLFITVVVSSIIIVRKHLRFETWYAVHLVTYAAIILASLHQFVIGSDFLVNPAFLYYWIALYTFTLLNLLVWRFGRTLWLYARHKFTVQKVVQETPTATSVYITGKQLQKFTAKGGQFVMVRFLDKSHVWQEHPFSLSALPNADHLRLTIRNLGDFTNTMPQLKSGTPVMVSGPFGTFTHGRQVTKKVVYIAGGIGITPIRSMIEERAQQGKKGDAVLLYGNRTVADTALLSELTQLATEINMSMHQVVSDEPGAKVEQGFIDIEKIKRLVPDVAARDVFLCGPPPMMAGVKKALRELNVLDRQVHYERFSLHKD